MHNNHIDGGTGLIFNFGAFIQFQKYYEETLIGLWGSTVFSTVCQKQIAIIMFTSRQFSQRSHSIVMTI